MKLQTAISQQRSQPSKQPSRVQRQKADTVTFTVTFLSGSDNALSDCARWGG